jgi:hypothetical protein
MNGQARQLPSTLRFGVFATLALGLPAAAFLTIRPTTVEEAGPAMLVFLGAPLLASIVSSWGRTRVPRSTAQVARGAGLTFAICAAMVTVNLGISWMTGGVHPGLGFDGAGLAAGVVTALITSTVEELGWAAGGWRVARDALGRARGIAALGAVWAAWHWNVAAWAPAPLREGMFPMGDPFAPALAASFVIGCIAFRWLLVEAWERGGVWAAASGHVAGNLILGGLSAGGLLRLIPSGPWWSFPGPTGLGFALGAALLAWVLMKRRRAAIGPPGAAGSSAADRPLGHLEQAEKDKSHVQTRDVTGADERGDRAAAVAADRLGRRRCGRRVAAGRDGVGPQVVSRGAWRSSSVTDPTPQRRHGAALEPPAVDPDAVPGRDRARGPGVRVNHVPTRASRSSAACGSTAPGRHAPSGPASDPRSRSAARSANSSASSPAPSMSPTCCGTRGPARRRWRSPWRHGDLGTSAVRGGQDRVNPADHGSTGGGSG